MDDSGSSEFFNAAFERFLNQLLDATNRMTSSFVGKDSQGRWKVGSVDVQIMMTGLGGICPLWPFC